MNDFTKDELEDLLKAYRHYYKYMYEGDIASPILIFEKLESLIDNYCINNGHNYEFSLGRGSCENCGELE